MKRRNVIRLTSVFMLAVMMLLAACSGQTNNQVSPYSNRGYEMGNSNPNIQTSPTSYNYRQVMKLARNVLSEIDGVQSSNVFVDGASMRVRLYVNDGSSEKQKQRILKEAREVLDYSFPVFKVKVKIAD